MEKNVFYLGDKKLGFYLVRHIAIFAVRGQIQ